MQGLHLTADLYGCACDPRLLADAQALAGLGRSAVAGAQLALVAERFHAFPPWQDQAGGVTGALLLAESHLALHTWPERGGVTLDVYVCNFTADNSAKAERLMRTLVDAFAPAEQHVNRIVRGGPLAHPAGPHATAGPTGPVAAGVPDAAAGEALAERLDEDCAFTYRAARRIEMVRTPYQTIEVFDTRRFGKLFRLDGAAMTSERDEFFYHENIVHPAALAHEAPASALVVGGGDGGSTEELLKHPTLRRVVMAELDAEVIGMARRHLHAVHRGALDDARLQVRVGDGFAFVAHTDERFDLVVLDLTDPDTPARRLYTPEFFRLVRRVLAPGGAVALHLGSPVFQPERVAALAADLRSVFRVVRPYTLYVPLYGSLWAMACASDTLDPLALPADEVARRIERRALPELRYYNADVHHALFALPTFVRQLVG